MNEPMNRDAINYAVEQEAKRAVAKLTRAELRSLKDQIIDEVLERVGPGGNGIRYFGGSLYINKGTSDDVAFRPYKNISADVLQTAIQEEVDDLGGSSGASLIGFLQSGTGATATNLQTRGRQIVWVTDYGAKCDGTTDDTTAWADAVAALGAGGGEVRFPAGTRSKGNITITAQNIRFKSYSFSRNSSLNMQLVPAVLASPVISVGDGTTLCTGFQTDGIVLDGLGTGAIGLKINGAAVCSYRNFSSQGFTDASVRITSSATQPTTYQFFDGYDIATNSSASAIGLDVIYGSQFTTAIYFSNGTIGAQSGSKYALQVTGASVLNLANTWVQIAASGKGVSLVTAGGVMGKISCSNVAIDSDTSTDVLVTLDANQQVADYIYGSVRIDGKATMTGGTTAVMGGVTNMWNAYPLLETPQIDGTLEFLYRANVWNQFDQVADAKCRIYRDVNGTLNIDTSGGGVGASVWVTPGSGAFSVINSGGQAQLQLQGSAGTATILQGASDLVLTPVGTNSIQMAGNVQINTGKGILSDHQTTVGAAGGASALPATPTGYAKLVDVTGTIYVVPYYASA